MSARFFILPGIPAREDGGAGRGTARGGREGIVKKDPLLCHIVKSGRMHQFAAIGSRMGIGLIIAHCKKNVGTRHDLFGFALAGKQQEGSHRDQAQGGRHRSCMNM